MTFSDTPTAKEVEKIKSECELKKDLKDIDTELIIDSSRKRTVKEETTVSSKKPKIVTNDEEEAEF